MITLLLLQAICIESNAPTVVQIPHPISVDKSDWPWWRGPTLDGAAPSDSRVPTSWTDQANVAWKSKVPGRGHGSAIVVGDRVMIAAADKNRNVQSVLCLDFKTGDRLWEGVAHRGGIFTGGNKKASQASSTPACDGKLVFINFLNNDAIYTTAFDLKGDIVWQRRICDYVVHQGYGSSPLIDGELVIVTADNKGGGRIVALNRATGDVVWQRERPKKPNYPSPIILTAVGKRQLILTGCDLITSLDPATGKENWEVDGATTECVTTSVTDGTNVFTSGGYPKNHISAVRADGSGKISWEVKSRVYVPSMLVSDGYLYSILDAGVAICHRCADGKEMWKHRINGTFSSSPLLAGGLILATNEAGVTTVFHANPSRYEQVSKNNLKAEVFSTPSLSRDRLFIRGAKTTGGVRQEFLYCIGSPE